MSKHCESCDRDWKRAIKCPLCGKPIHEIIEEMSKVLTSKEVVELHAFLMHGSRAHQAWLLSAIIAWNDGEPKPDPYD